MNRDGYRDQIVTHDVDVSLHSKTHPLFMKYSNGTSTVLCISLSELVSCAFSTIPICPFLIPRIFHLLLVQCHAFWASGSDPTGCGQKATCPDVCFMAVDRTRHSKLFTGGGQYGRIAYD